MATRTPLYRNHLHCELTPKPVQYRPWVLSEQRDGDFLPLKQTFPTWRNLSTPVPLLRASASFESAIWLAFSTCQTWQEVPKTDQQVTLKSKLLATQKMLLCSLWWGLDVKWLIISHHDCKVSWSWIIMNPICNINQLSRDTYEDDWRCVSSQFSPSLTKAEPPFANDWMSLDPLSVHTAFFTASSSAFFRAFQGLFVWVIHFVSAATSSPLLLCSTRKNNSKISFKRLPKTSEEKHLSNRATALTLKSYTSKIREFLLISETCIHPLGILHSIPSHITITPNPTIFQHHPRLWRLLFCQNFCCFTRCLGGLFLGMKFPDRMDP